MSHAFDACKRIVFFSLLLYLEQCQMINEFTMTLSLYNVYNNNNNFTPITAAATIIMTITIETIVIRCYSSNSYRPREIVKNLFA